MTVTSRKNAEFLADFQLAFEELFSRTYYLGPLREYPRRQYTWAGAQPADMGQRGERVVDALLASREQDKISRGPGRSKTKWTVEQFVADWLRKLGLIHEFRVEPIAKSSNIYRVLVRKSPDTSSVLITDVGFGVSQILPVLTLCYYVPEGSTLLLEQPEIHLNPSIQAGLGDVFVDLVRNAGKQFIIETHSEHLISRIRTAIARGSIGVKDVSVYYCSLEAQAGRVRRLPITDLGEFEEWPEGFFEDEVREAFARTQAVFESKRGSA
jgi:predicted ATPase